MRIIIEKPIKEFWLQHAEAEAAMKEWIKKVKLVDWNNFSDVRKTFNHADIYKCCLIFDVGGNNYRIIAKIKYEFKIVYIRYVLTHNEYDQNKWQNDCLE